MGPYREGRYNQIIYIKEFIDSLESYVIMHSLPGSSLYRGNNAGCVDTGQRLFRGKEELLKREDIEKRENQHKRHYFH